jgi:spermidine synthase
MPTSAPRRLPALPPVAVSEFDGVRSLHLGSIWVQGAMRIAQPDRIELDYVQRMLAALLWRPLPAAGRAVHLGLGAGTLARFTHRILRLPTLAVEINPAVISACRREFRLPADGPRLQVLTADAGDWVADPANAASACLLFVDLYDHEAAAPVLDDEPFYAACRRVLEPGGVMSVNLFGRDARFARSLGAITAAFGADRVCPLRPTREGNQIVLAGRDIGLPDRATLRDRAATIEARYGRFGLPARKWLRMLRPLVA